MSIIGRNQLPPIQLPRPLETIGTGRCVAKERIHRQTGDLNQFAHNRPDATTRQLLGVELVAEALADDDEQPARGGWSPVAPTAADRILLEQRRRLDGRPTLTGPQFEQLVAAQQSGLEQVDLGLESDLVN